MARWIESWMPPETDRGPEGGHRGARFGLPARGVSAVAGSGRRLLALVIDWFVGYGIAFAIGGPAALGSPGFSWAVLGVWFVLTAVPVAIFGSSVGMTVVGIRVAPIGVAAVVGVPRAVLRTLLIALVLPPVFRDADGRGWHDLAARTIVVRTRA